MGGAFGGPGGEIGRGGGGSVIETDLIDRNFWMQLGVKLKIQYNISNHTEFHFVHIDNVSVYLVFIYIDEIIRLKQFQLYVYATTYQWLAGYCEKYDVLIICDPDDNNDWRK